MKQYVCFIVTAVVLLASIFISTNFEVKGDELTSSQNISETKESRYLLKDSGGHIAVYKDNEFVPMITTETLTNTLPLRDQENLKKGITVKGDTALRKALEDYCS